jgi:hypothetical protein
MYSSFKQWPAAQPPNFHHDSVKFHSTGHVLEAAGVKRKCPPVMKDRTGKPSFKNLHLVQGFPGQPRLNTGGYDEFTLLP